MSMNKLSRTVKSIVRLLIYWRLLTLMVAWTAVTFLSISESFTFIQWINPFAALSKLWSNFDGVHYLNIAKYGYGSQQTGFTQAFFPLYPILIRYLTAIFHHQLFAALLISHLSLVASVYFLVKLIQLDYPSNRVTTVLYTFFLFPTTFFLVAAYNESLFLLLTLAAFYMARTKKFLYACLFAALASATRVTGIFLFPALVFEFWQQHKYSFRPFLAPKSLILLLCPLGLLLYMYYLKSTTGDPFFFAHVQPLFNNGRNVTEITLLPQVFFRYLKMMIFVDHSSITFVVALFELLSASSFLFLIIYSFRLRISYGIFALSSYLLPTLTGTFSSLPRYVLTIFPAFVVFGSFLHTRPLLRTGYYFLSGLSLIVFLTLFATGHFVG